jgi:hypothetical protein
LNAANVLTFIRINPSGSLFNRSSEIIVPQLNPILFFSFQTEIAKRLNAIIAQILPFLSQEHQQQVATAVERAKQVTMTELNAIIGVSIPSSLACRLLVPEMIT